MVLKLNYRVNEGINISEDSENVEGKSVDIIVRRIKSGDAKDHRISVILEFICNNSRESREFFQEQKYRDIKGIKCDLSVPIQYPVRLDKIFLEFFAPKTVEISQRAMYPVKPYNL